MSRATLAAVAVAALATAACGTAPLSFIDGQPFSRVTVNRYPVRIVAVDGQAYFHEPVLVAPGLHTIVAEAAPSRGPHIPLQKGFVLDVQPCTRYHIAADRESPLVPEWTPVVESTEQVAGCNPEEELRKAKAAG